MDAKELVSRIVDEVQTEAKKVTGFNHGAIKLMFVPMCGLAKTYLNDFGASPKIDLGFVIGKGYLRPAGWRNNEDIRELDCKGDAAIKIALLDREVSNYDLLTDMEKATWKPSVKGGCVAFDILVCERDNHLEISGPKPYLRIIVSVSGADDEENKTCALAARQALNHLCNMELDVRKFGYNAESVFYLQR